MKFVKIIQVKMIRGFLSWLAEHKLVTLLSVVLFSFVVATIAVAVEKSNMQDDLDICYQRLTEATRTTEATTESTTDSPTTDPPKPPVLKFKKMIIIFNYI